MGSGQASLVKEEGNLLTLGKCENAARRGLRTREEKGGDHFNFWSKSSESESYPHLFAPIYSVVFVVIISA